MCDATTLTLSILGHKMIYCCYTFPKRTKHRAAWPVIKWWCRHCTNSNVHILVIGGVCGLVPKAVQPFFGVNPYLSDYLFSWPSDSEPN
jgi:hypothetical protein